MRGGIGKPYKRVSHLSKVTLSDAFTTMGLLCHQILSTKRLDEYHANAYYRDIINERIIDMDQLTDNTLIDRMYHGLKRFEAVQQPYTPYIAMWQKWVRS
jgi:hypothetical protein